MKLEIFAEEYCDKMYNSKLDANQQCSGWYQLKKMVENNIDPTDENMSVFHENLRKKLRENWADLIATFHKTPQYKMDFWLSYNEKSGTYRIDEVGKTLQSQNDDADYKTIGGSNSLQELKNFVETMTLISFHCQVEQYSTSIEKLFKNRFSKLVIRNFEGNDF